MLSITGIAERLGDLERPDHAEAGDHVRAAALDLAAVDRAPVISA